MHPIVRRMKKRLRMLAVVGTLLCALRPASAHPLGPASVDHYSHLNLTPSKVILVYTLDMAEIATVEETRRIDTNGDGTLDDAEKSAYARTRAGELAAGLHLAINGQPLVLTPVDPKLSILIGQANLPTLRLSTVMETAPGALAAALRDNGTQAGAFRDDNVPGRVGWRQIGVGGLGLRFVDQSVNGGPATAPSPGDAADAKGDRTNARAVGFHFVPGGAADPAPASAVASAIPPGRREVDPFAALMTAEHLAPAKVLLFLLVAAGLGGLHALSPGHGKTLVAAYLVGSRGTLRHAFILGLIVTVTHTAGIFVLGLITLFASRYLLPETLYPWLTAASGLVIAQVGLFRLFGRGGHHHHEHHRAHEHSHSHEHAHDDGHEHEHSHGHVHSHHEHKHEHEHNHLPPPGEPITWRSLLALGVSGGMVPCPSALVVLLSAVALHQIGFGLLLIVAFSIGLAGVLIAIGIAVVRAHHFLNQRELLPHWFLHYVPKASAFAIVGIGLAIAVPAVMLLARRYGS